MGQKKILDWNHYSETAIRSVAEGVVLLKNEKQVLPLKEGAKVAVFGRIQFDYYKSGTGSGGMVNVSHVVGITEALRESGLVEVNKELLSVYEAWCMEHPFDLGTGWGAEPWSQKEMELEESLCERVAAESETALVIIGRTAGEDQDNRAEKGAYFLSEEEEQMLSMVRKHFEKVVVLLNVGGLIDMGFVETYAPDAVLYVWQGGMLGGTGTARVLTGEITPSGKLPDTIAYKLEDYPSHPYFGSKERNFYSEDIYVGYRYFETFAKDRVMYPFGFGLSYTTFSMETRAVSVTKETVKLEVAVTNTGETAGKEVVQVYCEAPQGVLGKPARVLCAYEKTKLLAPQETQVLSVCIQIADLASFDDLGKTGHPSCFVLEAGEYTFYVGADVRSAKKAAATTAAELCVVSKHEKVLAPVLSFPRIVPEQNGDGYSVKLEEVPGTEPLDEARRLERLPKELAYTGDKGIKLADVADGRADMDAFIAQFSDENLACIIRGEGMSSPKVTPGTASTFGGVTDELSAFGIPCACCADGPAGIRMDCGTKAFSIPNGTLLASTFNKELVYELFTCFGLEAAYHKVDCMLGPGMNLHRHPLNGRNFEYFSEDPYLTGTMGAAELKGFHSAGVTGTIKHFCGNDQESGRHTSDSVISERALREIYLRCFEIAVKDGNARTVMTTYGSLNGVWTAGNYDLATAILRDDWGFTGLVMTDWWAAINRRNQPVDKRDFAAMAQSQNDVYMVCTDSLTHDDNVMEALADGRLTRSELQRNAANICRFLTTTHALKRLRGTEDVIERINYPEEEEDDGSVTNLTYNLGDYLEIDMTGISSKKGGQHTFMLNVEEVTNYRFTITASSMAGELAQMPVTLYIMGTPYDTFTWNGTGGKPVSFTGEYFICFQPARIRLAFGQNGLDFHKIVIEKIK
ncbi:MAG: glycoside hydrolase family 3 C-terminal domain-containing protein [Lachnospiraceae bacterium]|nr:glycoside hydrolase family 3 C-terminal domain-containing protein [Lachnospiraceae bacterium]